MRPYLPHGKTAWVASRSTLAVPYYFRFRCPAKGAVVIPWPPSLAVYVTFSCWVTPIENSRDSGTLCCERGSRPHGGRGCDVVSERDTNRRLYRVLHGLGRRWRNGAPGNSDVSRRTVTGSRPTVAANLGKRRRFRYGDESSC
jgi:hypothetical protein